MRAVTRVEGNVYFCDFEREQRSYALQFRADDTQPAAPDRKSPDLEQFKQQTARDETGNPEMA